jgi:hypothetical protein
MAEKLTVYEPGDRFATIATTGRARVWTVLDDGTLVGPEDAFAAGPDGRNVRPFLDHDGGDHH